MYDKVKLWMDKAMVGENISAIANHLIEAKEQTDLRTGEVKTFGSLEGLKVTILVGGISLVGSLPKYYFGSNVYNLDRNTTLLAVEKLSDALHVDVSKASVTGLEFGNNFVMAHPVQDYLAKLGDLPRLKRYFFDPTTLYYKGRGKHHPKVLVFYDKMGDAIAKGMGYPDHLSGTNLLRYEMRFNGRLPQQLGVPEVNASTLYEKSFYRLMVERYQDEYYLIPKLNQIKTNIMNEIKTVSDAFNVFVARLISQTGQAQIGGFVSELKEAGVFEDRNNYSRLKKKIQGVASKASITISDELIRELDDDIKNCGAYV